MLWYRISHIFVVVSCTKIVIFLRFCARCLMWYDVWCAVQCRGLYLLKCLTWNRTQLRNYNFLIIFVSVWWNRVLEDATKQLSILVSIKKLSKIETNKNVHKFRTTKIVEQFQIISSIFDDIRSIWVIKFFLITDLYLSLKILIYEPRDKKLCSLFWFENRHLCSTDLLQPHVDRVSWTTEKKN